MFKLGILPVREAFLQRPFVVGNDDNPITGSGHFVVVFVEDGSSILQTSNAQSEQAMHLSPDEGIGQLRGSCAKDGNRRLSEVRLVVAQSSITELPVYRIAYLPTK